jgi:hypothetical protein
MKGEGDGGIETFNHEAAATRSRRSAGAMPPRLALAPARQPHHLENVASFSFGVLPPGPFGGASSRYP